MVVGDEWCWYLKFYFSLGAGCRPCFWKKVAVSCVEWRVSGQGDCGSVRGERLAEGRPSRVWWAGFPVAAWLCVAYDDVCGSYVVWVKCGGAEGVVGCCGGVDVVHYDKSVVAHLVEPVVENADVLFV